ncbi:hypothetical protein SAMN05216588_12629 [Pseudomonas flavescens]|uniref:Uncharacterized protein n=1 Tax=Phytopseudomonas flavescens TaxID=29435 RepID=A0A1G8NVJ3_9GAMM|nr:hypothetical protein [Pseudomonas flavescens]SDI84138.1 hypothetical protein SAMN05216588_12629 [Pseudomonas flavescens]
MHITYFAHCGKDGAIQIGRKVPDGAIGIAKGTRDVLHKVLAGTAVTGPGGETLVPGMRESATERAALTELARFIQQLGEQNKPGFRALGA